LDLDPIGRHSTAGGTDRRLMPGPRQVHRLVERGARTTMQDAATLGLMDRLRAYFAAATPPEPADVSGALWGACHGGQPQAAAYLLDRGAELDWIPDWEHLTPLDAATRGGATELVAWLRRRGARTAAELGR
jgi:uncharacterized protein